MRNKHYVLFLRSDNMGELKNDSRENELAAAAVKYGAWLLGLVIVLYFISRNVFPFIQSLF